jgi:adenosine kinase
MGIVSPGNVSDMIEYPRLFRKLGIRYIFDPGQQITALSGPDMLEAITGSYMLVTNDYELEMVIKATGQTRDQIKARTSVLATTLGEKGALLAMNGEEIRVGAPGSCAAWPRAKAWTRPPGWARSARPMPWNAGAPRSIASARTSSRPATGRTSVPRPEPAR